MVAGLLLGLAIGAVSALLGVAGGELLIPTPTLAFGADVRTAGTASLMISLVAVGSGLWRYGRLGMFPSGWEMTETVLPMGAGSVVGAVTGGVVALRSHSQPIARASVTSATGTPVRAWRRQPISIPWRAAASTTIRFSASGDAGRLERMIDHEQPAEEHEELPVHEPEHPP